MEFPLSDRLLTSYSLLLTPFFIQKHSRNFTDLIFIKMNTTLLFLGGVGFQEILLIGLFVLVFFGAKKIPEFMKGLGKGVKEFKDAMSDVKKDIESSAKEASKIDDGKA
jgi:sec-independent protein translocase protein TatA